MRFDLDRVAASLITLCLMATQPPATFADTDDPKSGSGGASPGVKVEQLQVEVLKVYPHDPTAYTQGLVWDGGFFYESTGLYGRSTVRRVDPSDGKVLEKVYLDPNFFGEGLARVGDRLILLTWKAGIAFVHDLATLEPIDEYGYNGEGWGLAYDGERLVMSNGSARLTYRDPEDFRWLSTLEVKLDGEPVDKLNELELAEGQLYANVWGENRIVRIDPDTGQVTAVIDAAGLLSSQEASMVDVLNGIAYDPASKTFWLTGKFWPKMFQVRFVPKP
jgi:glutaminyl-peptide cyclotransferase